MIQSLTHEPISGVLGLVQILMQVTVLVFLFQSGSSVWFKAMKKLKSENAHQGALGGAPKAARPELDRWASLSA